MIELSAPTKSGFCRQYESIDAAREKAADLLGVSAAEMIEVGPIGGEDITYCYATQEDADTDSDGAYAVQYKLAASGQEKKDER